MANIDPRTYNLHDFDTRRNAPVQVVATVAALLPDEPLTWQLVQTWDDGGLWYWRVLGLTESQLVLVSASAEGSTPWIWNLDEKLDAGNVTEAWTRPLSDVEALHCDAADVGYDRFAQVITSEVEYSVTLRGRADRLFVSARPTQTTADAESVAQFAHAVLAHWR